MVDCLVVSGIMSKIWKCKFNKWTQIGEYNKKDNLHNNTSAGTVLQAIKGGKDGRPAVERSLTSDDSQTGVQRTKQFRRRHNASSDCCRFRTSLQEDLQDRTTAPTLSYSRFVADSHDHLEFLQTWLSAAGTITFKLFDAPLNESSAANSTIFASVGRR